MVKNSLVTKRWIFKSVLIGTPRSLDCNKAAILDITWYLYIYLKSAYHDEQNGGQSFNLRARIAKLWRFKARKLEKDEKDDSLAIFKPGLWWTGFSDVAKNGTISSSN